MSFDPLDSDDWFDATLYTLLDHWAEYRAEWEARLDWEEFLARVREGAWDEGYRQGKGQA